MSSLEHLLTQSPAPERDQLACALRNVAGSGRVLADKLRDPHRIEVKGLELVLIEIASNAHTALHLLTAYDGKEL